MKLNYFHKAAAVLVVIAAFGLTKASAQSTTGQTTLNVVLEPFLSITVNDNVVTLTLSNAAEYESGVSVKMPAHLKVSSLMPYTINLKSDNATLVGTTHTDSSINANVVSVSLPSTSTNAILGGTFASITGLTDANQPLITDATPAIDRSIDVQYAIPSSQSNSAAILGQPADTYHSTITYTISSL